jgi:hypothetical protein
MRPVIDEEAEMVSVVAGDGGRCIRWAATAFGWTYSTGRLLEK